MVLNIKVKRGSLKQNLHVYKKSGGSEAGLDLNP